MCLSTVTRDHKDNPIKKERFAWKRFEVDYRNNLIFPHQNLSNISVGKWMKDPNAYLLYESGGLRAYQTGYHAYKTKKSAMAEAFSDEVVLKIRIRGITAIGTQGPHAAYVAGEMFIIPTKQLPRKRRK